MSVNLTGYNVVYGITNSQQPVIKNPFSALRAPKSTDVAEVGQQWVYNDEVWMFTSSGTWSQLASEGNEGTFTQLTVNGNSEFNGDADFNGAVTITDGAFLLQNGANDISIGTDAVEKDIEIGNSTDATSLTLTSGSGGIVLDGGGTGDIDIVGNYADGVSYTFTNNARVGSQNIVVVAPIEVNDVITLTMTNNFITSSTVPTLVTVTTNATGGGILQVIGIVLSVGGNMTITAKNVGSATISEGVSNVVVTFMILGGQ